MLYASDSPKPDFAQAHSNLGVTLKELGRLNDAAATFKRAIALKPDFAQAHSNLGNTLKELGRLDEAEASYNEAIALKPDFAEAHTNLGSIFHEAGGLDEAETSLRKALDLQVDNSSVKHLLSAITGKLTRTAPRDYIEELFDHYADKFEVSLVNNLEYKIPRVISEIIIKDSGFDCLGSIMDLGCGTGLFGMEIKRFCENLEGIDISGKKCLIRQKKKMFIIN